MPNVTKVEDVSKALICGQCDAGSLSLILNDDGIKIWRCDTCPFVGQQIGDELHPVRQLLQRNALGDDRVRAAASSPHVKTVKGFLDTYESAAREFRFILAEGEGGLRTVLAQLENRVDFALSRLSGLGLIDDSATEGLDALREARDLISVTRGRPQKGE